MNRLIITIGLLLFFGISVSEIHRVIYYEWPNTATLEYDLFLSKKYHAKITVLWYIYELCNILNRIIWCYVFSMLAIKLNNRLFFIGVIFLVYFFTQFFFYIWDRNTSFSSNVLIIALIGLCLTSILWPPKKAKIRNFD